MGGLSRSSATRERVARSAGLGGCLVPPGFDGDVVPSTEGVELILGRVGTLLEYPFREDELRTLARELAP